MPLSRRCLLAGLALSALPTAPLMAQKPARRQSNLTAVFVKDMHCATCAKKIARELYKVPGVVQVKTNVKKSVAIIVPQATRTPSLKRVWEAVEEAKFKPIKIATSQGVFTKKPRR